MRFAACLACSSYIGGSPINLWQIVILAQCFVVTYVGHKCARHQKQIRSILRRGHPHVRSFTLAVGLARCEGKENSALLHTAWRVGSDEN